MDALAEFNSRAVKKLLRDGADPNYVDRNGYTPISWVSDVSDARALLAAGARMDGAGASAAICRAIEGKDPAMVAWLLAHGANPNVITPDGDLPLTDATDWNETSSALALLRAGAKVSPPRQVEDSLVVCAAIDANPELVVAFLRHGADPNSLSTEATWGIGRTALFWAATNVDVASVAALLARGASPNLSRCGETPLTAALRSRYDGSPSDWDHRSRRRYLYDQKQVIVMLRSFGATLVPVDALPAAPKPVRRPAVR
ncbi:MAG: ankyrin repeat domain-containing protein [Armatimonadetes bacterium]|nr:ankyrin repeat domain-containing protein [Armatimonadota bacterium]MDE2206172.1 ankyrin repeat domain-containing protein [Armatimonadota bacterium]